MNPEQQVAYIQSQILCAQAEIEAMKVDNLTGVKMWSSDDFRNIPYKYCLHHNDVIGFFTGR